jgi:hypothetical protein
MTRLKLLGAAAILSTALATPLMAQEATQEPGAIGFNYPNSNYLTGGYGVHTPYNTGRYPRLHPGYAYYGGGPVYAPRRPGRRCRRRRAIRRLRLRSVLTEIGSATEAAFGPLFLGPLFCWLAFCTSYCGLSWRDGRCARDCWYRSH